MTSSFAIPSFTSQGFQVSTGRVAGPLEKPSAKEEFLDYARMTPAERMRDAILKELGLTEEDLEGMEPEARKAMKR
ncbi:hypothetical protein GCM10007276_31270 [Agaricicola taiwanensis]|uniref:Uncharacterized protein n=1 Tax=Agaricicola taiwanensis TaxID=591372 RepID=A0A8J2YM24_9RHOB|nr:hypothetical protein [Agaricicola taiwanensis]GGE51936.1 hypothetical protein GCM10007276_31270 [Agaricicola taiwanensis]